MSFVLTFFFWIVSTETFSLSQEETGFLTLGWLRLDGSMAETVEVVNEFLADIGSRVAPLGQRELETLNELKSKDEKLVSPVGDGGIAYWWDK